MLHFHLSRSKISSSDDNVHDTHTGMKLLLRGHSQAYRGLSEKVPASLYGRKQNQEGLYKHLEHLRPLTLWKGGKHCKELDFLLHCSIGKGTDSQKRS